MSVTLEDFKQAIKALKEPGAVEEVVDQVLKETSMETNQNPCYNDNDQQPSIYNSQGGMADLSFVKSAIVKIILKLFFSIGEGLEKSNGNALCLLMKINKEKLDKAIDLKEKNVINFLTENKQLGFFFKGTDSIDKQVVNYNKTLLQQLLKDELGPIIGQKMYDEIIKNNKFRILFIIIK
jgi:hypothetical protein